MRAAQLILAALLAALALVAEAKVVSFGSNSYFNLGFGYPNRTSTSLPGESTVTNEIAVRSIAAGNGHVLLVSESNKAFAYGYNDYGQLGFGNISCTYDDGWPYSSCAYPGHVGDGTAAIKAVSAGAYFSLALTTAGNVTAFGYNWYGQLGDGTSTQRETPVEIPTPEAIAAISCGDSFSLALSESGKVYSWGYNIYGQLGVGSTSTKYSPVAVDTSDMNTTITAIAAGDSHAVALDENGQVWAWGRNSDGELGIGESTSEVHTPRRVNMSDVDGTVVAIAAGNGFTLLLTDSGAVYSFGLNTHGQLGDGTDVSKRTAVAVDTSGVLKGVKIAAISAGQDHALALSEAGKVYSWGYNFYGQLGDGTEETRKSPVAVFATSGELYGAKVKSVHAAHGFSVLLVEDGNVPDSASAASASLLAVFAAVIAALAVLF